MGIAVIRESSPSFTSITDLLFDWSILVAKPDFDLILTVYKISIL